ncbi:MAG: hypothetical protein ACRCSF_04575, partial [Mycobacteriaceae bacterium]
MQISKTVKALVAVVIGVIGLVLAFPHFQDIPRWAAHHGAILVYFGVFLYFSLTGRLFWWGADTLIAQLRTSPTADHQPAQATSSPVAALIAVLGLVISISGALAFNPHVGTALAGPAEDCQAVRDRDHAIYLQLIAALPPGSPIPPEIINPCLEAPSNTPTTTAPAPAAIPTGVNTGSGIHVGSNAATNMPTYNGTDIVPAPNAPAPATPTAAINPITPSPVSPAPSTASENITPTTTPAPVTELNTNIQPATPPTVPETRTSSTDQPDTNDPTLALITALTGFLTARKKPSNERPTTPYKDGPPQNGRTLGPFDPGFVGPVAWLYEVNDVT